MRDFAVVYVVCGVSALVNFVSHSSGALLQVTRVIDFEIILSAVLLVGSLVS
jgi:hypothetical protein